MGRWRERGCEGGRGIEGGILMEREGCREGEREVEGREGREGGRGERGERGK